MPPIRASTSTRTPYSPPLQEEDDDLTPRPAVRTPFIDTPAQPDPRRCYPTPTPDHPYAHRTGSLTPEQKQTLMAENRCFHCMEVGHRSRQCRYKPRRNQGPPIAQKMHRRRDAPRATLHAPLNPEQHILYIAGLIWALPKEDSGRLFDLLIAKESDF